MMRKVPMTVAGAERLREELQRLKTEDRPRVIAAIAEARAHGDLKENAEYHAAREQQSFIEGRINEKIIPVQKQLKRFLSVKLHKQFGNLKRKFKEKSKVSWGNNQIFQEV